MFLMFHLNYNSVNIVFVWFLRSWGLRLRIREAKLSDKGSYICVANNSEGTISTEAFLTVNGM